MSKSTLIYLVGVFLCSKSVEGMKLIKAVAAQTIEGESMDEQMIANFQELMRATYSPGFVSVWSVFALAADWSINWVNNATGSTKCTWVVLNTHEDSEYKYPLERFKLIVAIINSKHLPEEVLDQFYGTPLTEPIVASKNEENEMIAKFQELMWAVKRDNEDTGEGVQEKLEDWTGWCNSHPYILAFACARAYTSGVFVSIPFDTVGTHSNQLRWVNKASCKWLVLNNGNQSVVQLHTLKEFKRIVDVIDSPGVPQSVRLQFYGREGKDNTSSSATFVVDSNTAVDKQPE